MAWRRTIYRSGLAGVWALGALAGCMGNGNPDDRLVTEIPFASADTPAGSLGFDAAVGPACPESTADSGAPSADAPSFDAEDAVSDQSTNDSDASDGDGDSADSGEAGLGAANVDARAPSQCEHNAARTGICVPQVSAGWEGPGVLLTADSPDQLTPCPTAAPSEFAVGSVLGAQPSTCAGCTCGDAQDLACGSATPHVLYWDNTCSYPACPPSGSGDDCISPRPTCGVHGSEPAFLAITSGQLSGTCVPSAPPAAPPVVHASAARACKTTVGTIGGPPCPRGATCIEPGFKTCIFKKGADLACPGSVYTERRLFYSSIDDSRVCASCSCGAPTGANCPTAMELRDGSPNTCTAPIVDIVETDSACFDVRTLPRMAGGAGSIHFVASEPKGQAACGASGTATGTLSESDPFTACCIP